MSEAANERWAVVTIHVSDGHEINGMFCTDDMSLLHSFANAVNPLNVSCSYHVGEREAKAFMSGLNEAFVEINPRSYLK